MSSGLIPWRKEIERLRREMDGLYDRFFDWRPLRHFTDLGDWWPPVDVSENPKEIIVHAEIPGVNIDEIDVHLEDDLLIIRGERKREVTEEGDEAYHTERSYGSFSRSIRLPSHIDRDGIKARYSNGVLELKLPKTGKPAQKRIKVETD
jgi:HSP20 family protein